MVLRKGGLSGSAAGEVWQPKTEGAKGQKEEGDRGSPTRQQGGGPGGGRRRTRRPVEGGEAEDVALLAVGVAQGANQQSLERRKWHMRNLAAT